MNIRIATLILALCTPLCALGQENIAVRDSEQVKPEEITIIGERVRKLRTQMMEAEIHTYDVFNKFNDDRRYTVNCSIRPPTGSRFKKAVCDTGFERDAMQEHARDYADNLAFGTTPNSIPLEAKISAQREGFQLKMKQVAKEHPEFLRALIQYSKKQKEFEDASTSWKQQN